MTENSKTIWRERRQEFCPKCLTATDHPVARADETVTVRACVDCKHEVTSETLFVVPESQATHFGRAI